MNKVTVIIPAYNNSAFTLKTVESIINQTYKNIEIIVIDDGSTDDTKKLLKKYNYKIIYVYQENQGACSARNKGMKLSTGTYIAHIDCDDIYEPTKISQCVDFLEKNPQYGFVYTDVKLIDSNDNPILGVKKFYNHPGSGYIAKKIIKSHYVLTNSTLLAKKECFLEVGGFDENIFISADREMIIRLSRVFKAGYINKPLTKYRVSNNRTYENLQKSLDEFIYIVHKYTKFQNFLSKSDQKISFANIYYYYFKLNISLGRYKEAKKLFYKIILKKFFYHKLYFIVFAMIIMYIKPSILKNYLRKYNISDYEYK